MMTCQVALVNLSTKNPTILNKVSVQKPTVVSHNDVFAVADRLFRVEFPEGPPSRVLQPVSNMLCCKINWLLIPVPEVTSELFSGLHLCILG